MAAYLAHHLKIAGEKEELFSEESVTAIHQSSGGLLRRAGALARGALLAAAREKRPRVSGEHVRIASTEITCFRDDILKAVSLFICSIGWDQRRNHFTLSFPSILD
jgi:hypothetical protein